MSNNKKYKSSTWWNNRNVRLEQNEQSLDIQDSKYGDKIKWFKTKNKSGEIVWKNGYVDEYKIPLFNGCGEYQPRVVRKELLKERNEREIYYRNNPDKSLWKKNLTKINEYPPSKVKILVKNGVKI